MKIINFFARRPPQVESVGAIVKEAEANTQDLDLSELQNEISRLKYFLGVNQWPELPVSESDYSLHLEVESIEELWSVAKDDIARIGPRKVLDIGCGVRPLNLHRFDTHVCFEPYRAYADSLVKRFGDVKSVIPIMGYAPKDLSMFPDNSFDSVFLVDVVEHMTREDGLATVQEARRIAKRSVHVFTPLGFMEQHVGSADDDGWGFVGNELQTHISGWEPKDFPGWKVTVCPEYHKTAAGTFGAIWASFFELEHSARQRISLIIPEALDHNTQWSNFLERLQRQFEVYEALIHPEMAPWSFRTKPTLDFPTSRLRVLSEFNWQELRNSNQARVAVLGTTREINLEKFSGGQKTLVVVLDREVLPKNSETVTYVSLEIESELAAGLQWLVNS